MWNKIRHWFHHLLDPHCLVCEKERKCPNCEITLTLLESERRDKQRILDRFLFVDKPTVVEDEQLPEPIFQPKLWDHKRQQLEFAERKRLMEENERANVTIRKTTEELENELLK